MEPPARRAFAEQPDGHHAGFRDAIGSHFRADAKNVAVWASYEWDGLFGKGIARLARNFGADGDALGEYRQFVELIWSMNYTMLLKLATEEELAELLPADVLALMQMHPDKTYVQTNWGVREIFESVIGDARIYPVTEINFSKNTALGRDTLAGA